MVPSDSPPSRSGSAASGRGAQVLLAGAVVVGPWHGLQPTVAHYAFAMVAIPAVLAAVGVSMTPPRRLWIAGGIALHPLGARHDLYQTVWWWDHLTHLVSATLVAALGYLCVARLAPRLGTAPSVTGGYVGALAVVVCGGLGWEVFELYWPTLTVYGPLDTLLDLTFDVIGWAVFVVAAPRYLTDVGPWETAWPPAEAGESTAVGTD